MSISNYTPVTTDELQELAQKHDMDWVVLLGFCADGHKTNAASWGRAPHHKDVAATTADQVVQALGLDRFPRAMHEDYRTTPEAQYKEQLDQLRLENKKLRYCLEECNRLYKEAKSGQRPQ